jgi:hypothetical protein
MARDEFRKDRNSLVVDLRPESHQLTLFKVELTKILDLGAFDHTIASFWYFIVLSEVLLALQKEIGFQAGRKPELFSQFIEIEKELTKLKIDTSGDFTARIDRLGSYVTQEIKACAARGERLTPEKLTNIVFRGNR